MEDATSKKEDSPFDEPPPNLKAAPRDSISEKDYRDSCEKGEPNYGVLVLEIGRWRARKNYPKGPPEWALEECRVLYERSQISTRPLFSPSLGPGGYQDDGRLLERVADLMIDLDLDPYPQGRRKRVSLRSSIKRALREAGKCNNIEPDIQRLTRHWEKDQKYRLERAMERYVEKRFGRRTMFSE